MGKVKYYLIKILLVSILTLNSCDKNNDDLDNSIVWENDTKGIFTDERDNKTYKIVKIGGQILFAENLAYEIEGKEITDMLEWKNNFDYDGWSMYLNAPDISLSYGILYQWEAAKKACPKGWHLMTDDEWSTLIHHLGNEYTAIGKLKETGTEHWFETNDNVTNESCFTALPGGYRDTDGVFRSLTVAGHWWSSTEKSDETTQAFLRSMGYNGNVLRTYIGKRHGFSVRCIKD